jgi:hypothetical protein
MLTILNIYHISKRLIQNSKNWMKSTFYILYTVSDKKKQDCQLISRCQLPVFISGSNRENEACSVSYVALVNKCLRNKLPKFSFTLCSVYYL